jgi:predicted nucleotidyltransferase
MKTIPSGLLEEAVDRLADEFAPEAIYLFGSHAWGDPTEDSDLDFFVIVPQSTQAPIERAQRAHGVLSELAAPKDVIVYTRAEVDRVKHLRASLTHQVLHRGRKLYG